MKLFGKILGLLMLGLSARANAEPLHINCTYTSLTGTLETVTFEQVDRPDLDPRRQVAFQVNGQPDPLVFEVFEVAMHVGSRLTYAYRHQIFVSDIVIHRDFDEFWNETIHGQWAVDHPPVLDLKCERH